MASKRTSSEGFIFLEVVGDAMELSLEAEVENSSVEKLIDSTWYPSCFIRHLQRKNSTNLKIIGISSLITGSCEAANKTERKGSFYTVLPTLHTWRQKSGGIKKNDRGHFVVRKRFLNKFVGKNRSILQVLQAMYKKRTTTEP